MHRSAGPRALLAAATWLVASCQDPASEPDEPAPLASDPLEDGLTIRVFDLIAPFDEDDSLLARLEVPIVGDSRIDGQGRRVYTIRSTGVFAGRLEAYGYRVVVHDPDEPVFRQGRPLSGGARPGYGPPLGCDPWPLDHELFAPYDNHPGAFRGGLAQEMSDMHNGATVITDSVATTIDGKEVLAVQVGPLESDPKLPTPTVYVFGTYHAREWVTEELTMQLLRHAVDVANGSGGDPSLEAALLEAALVFVPVVNPDGYEFSHTTYRDQRKNRNPTTCGTVNFQGVDINRNHVFGWGGTELAGTADSGTTDGCVDSYIGSPPVFAGVMRASEEEPAGIEALLRGEFFVEAESGPRQPAAMFSYHAYATVGIYPNGLKEVTDGDGPRCIANDNCLSPDLMVHRRLFGDTENPLTFNVLTGMPYQSDMLNNVLYTTSGDVTAHAAHTGDRMLAITHEITDTTTEFYPECSPDPAGLMFDLFTQHIDLVTGVLAEAPKLVATTTAAGYAPQQMGTFAPGLWAREASDGFDHDSARPRFLKPVWRDASIPPPLMSKIDGAVYPLDPARSADQYEMHMLELQDTANPWCIPCLIETFDQESGEPGVDGWSCEGCIDLTDAGRLEHNGWTHVDAGDDYWWEPSGTPPGGAMLHIGGGTAPPDASHCHLMFSTKWSSSSPGAVVLERMLPTGLWEHVQRWPYASPVFELRTRRRLRSYIVEANDMLPDIAKFRFRTIAGPIPDFLLYEPVVYCRLGALP